YKESNDNVSALSEFKQFIQSLEAIAHSAGDDRNWQYELSTAYGHAASAYLDLKSYDVCEALIDKWREAARKLSAFDPENVLWRTSYAQSLAFSGLVIRDQIEVDPRGADFFGQALETYQQLSVQVPNNDNYLHCIDELTADLVRYHNAKNELEEA